MYLHSGGTNYNVRFQRKSFRLIEGLSSAELSSMQFARDYNLFCDAISEKCAQSHAVWFVPSSFAVLLLILPREVDFLPMIQI